MQTAVSRSKVKEGKFSQPGVPELYSPPTPCLPDPPVPRQVCFQAFCLLGVSHPSADGGLPTVRPRRPGEEAASLPKPGGPPT